ncbi:hypothetical protein N1851_011034 [Merluccius polli]|uniref:Alkylated DNA repair protein AlkB homologue 8 N-terminal domain-containing protein n=1 Tax=Merluccius polli TaxID=89951 RepID=A0AA47MYL1_MERPO|nr:hypothetical protein N1851_011034 [Merluccius polli]
MVQQQQPGSQYKKKQGKDLSWGRNITSATAKAQQRLYILRKLRWSRLPQRLMVNFYHCAVESVLTYGLLVWFSGCTSAEKEAIHRVVRAAGKIIGVIFPDITTVYTSRCMRRVENILQDHLHQRFSIGEARERATGEARRDAKKK